MSLDHPYTCPDIDRAINSAKDEIYNQVRQIVLDNNPWLEHCNHLPDEFEFEIKQAAECLSDIIADLFEDVRSCNEDMRTSADKQLSELEDNIEDLEFKVDELQTVINDMEAL